MGEAIWSYSTEDTKGDHHINGEQRMSKGTKGTAEFFKVDKAILVLIYQAEDPEREGALGSAESPGLKQWEKHTKLLET